MVGIQPDRPTDHLGAAAATNLAWMHDVNDLGVFGLGKGETQDGGDDFRVEGEDHGEARPCPKGGA